MDRWMKVGIMGLCVAGQGAATEIAYWRFEEQSTCGKKQGDVSWTNDVPARVIWTGDAWKTNAAALTFTGAPATGSSIAPAGSECVVEANQLGALRAGDVTVETYVKMRQLTGRHMLLVSKRRFGQEGASFSLSIAPDGRLGVRFDTQPGRSGPGFNQTVGSSYLFADTAWHHVALVYRHAAQEASLFVDYTRVGKEVLTNPLVIDDSPLVIGRGLTGMLDEIRLTAEALHPEQFLRATRFYSDLVPKKVVTQPVFLDQSYTRVQTYIRPELKRIGTLIPKSVHEINNPLFSLGCETLDRDIANWDVYKGYLEPLGIRRIRLQGGWAKTEKKKGVYDWQWLDTIVEDAHRRGLVVCMETSYCNTLYDPKAALGPGGLLPSGEEELAAWDRWVEAMAKRYTAKGVTEWMMFNEPNLRKENTVDKIVANNIRTAQIIKRVNPDAKIAAFVLAGLNMKMLEDLIAGIKAQGKEDLFHWACYHGYAANPDSLAENMTKFHELLKREVPKWRPWQGESGCASEPVQYALSGIDWTEYSHAKWNARRMLCDIGHDIESCVFTISDLTYSRSFISRYGLLKTDSENNLVKVKMAYYMVQHVATLFTEQRPVVAGYRAQVEGCTNVAHYAFRDQPTGLDLLTLWDTSDVPGNGATLTPVNVTVMEGQFKEPVWVDIVNGGVYEIPASRVERSGTTITFKEIPIYDSPIVLMDRSLLRYEPPKVVLKQTQQGKVPQLSAKRCELHLLKGTQQPAPVVLLIGLASEEATAWASWLNEQAIHAAIVPDLNDCRLAVAMLKGNASAWQVREQAIGVLTSAVSAEQLLAADLHLPFALHPALQDQRTLCKRTHLLTGDKTAVMKFLEPFKQAVFQ